MSTSLILAALRKYNLTRFYPTLMDKNMLTVNKISQLSDSDLAKVGVNSEEDRKKFAALSKDLNEAKTKSNDKLGNSTLTTANREMKTSTKIGSSTPIRTNNTTRPIKHSISPARSNNNNIIPVYATTKSSTNTSAVNVTPSRKRPFPQSSTVAPKLSPERKARRMTIAPHTFQHISPPKISARERRLSYLPRRDNSLLPRKESNLHRSPTKITKTNLFKKVEPPLKKPKLIETSYVEPLKEPLAERPSTRNLNAYGIPITPRQQTLTNKKENNAAGTTVTIPSLAEFLLSKSQEATTTFSTNTTTPVSSELQERIRVCVRKRPLSKKELANSEIDIVPVVGARTIELNAPKTRIDLSRYTEKHTFTFHEAFDSHITNKQIYSRTAQPLVDYIFTSGNATCFAFGQTGSGKTFTMLDPQQGLYVLAAQDIFSKLTSRDYNHLSASVGFYEIYQNNLFDLLNEKAKLNAREDGNGNVVIAGLHECAITDVSELMHVLEYGNQGRTTGKTGANNTSSRSHAVIQILLKHKETSKLYSKLSFIDLAGSERGADRGDGDTKTRMEGAEINKSLLALKECIRAVDNNLRHTPFRGSKLTQVLRDSFTGNSRTCMIATISPNNYNSEHTLNTLRYADRVKEFKGESDPRISNEYHASEAVPVEEEEQVNRRLAVREGSHHSQKKMVDDADVTSLASFDEENNDILFDQVQPPEFTEDALATPTNTNNRFVSLTDYDRKQHYMKRLESPPAEMFDSNTIISDPFYSKPLTPISVKEPTNEESKQKKPGNVDIGRIKSFLNLHRAQIKENENIIREEKRIITKLSLVVSSHQDFRTEGESYEVEDQQSREEYETYLNDLEDFLERKVQVVDVIRNKIKEELDDEEL